MNDQDVDKMFDRLAEMQVDLDYDPIQRGPKFLNNQVAEVRNYTNEVQAFMRGVHKYIRTLERNLRIAEADFEVSYNDLMANDPEIRAMRSLSRADREAAVNSRLVEEQQEIHRLQIDLTDAKHVQTVLKDKLRELREVISAIRLQRDLIKAEIDTGSYWGTDNTPDSNHMTLAESLQEEASLQEPDELSPESVEEEEPSPFTAPEEEDIDLEDLIEGLDFSSNGRNTSKKKLENPDSGLTLKVDRATVVRDQDTADLFSESLQDYDYDQMLQDLA